MGPSGPGSGGNDPSDPDGNNNGAASGNGGLNGAGTAGIGDPDGTGNFGGPASNDPGGQLDPQFGIPSTSQGLISRAISAITGFVGRTAIAAALTSVGLPPTAAALVSAAIVSRIGDNTPVSSEAAAQGFADAGVNAGSIGGGQSGDGSNGLSIGGSAVENGESAGGEFGGIGSVAVPEAVFDPSLIFQGIDLASGLTNQGIEFATDQFGQASAFQEPFFNNAQGFQQFAQGVQNGDFDARNDANAFTFDETDPEFQFLIDRGIDTINAAASATGSLQSGSRLKDLQTFGQSTANQFASDVLNRRLAIAQNNASNAQSLAGFEANAANNLSNIRTGLGTLGANGLFGLGSNALSALTTGAGLENATEIANAGNALSAGLGELDAATRIQLGELSSDTQTALAPAEPSSTGQAIGAVAAFCTANPGLCGFG